jgi:metal-responsive CopG/Arc/MetJ family transcriptional regulator
MKRTQVYIPDDLFRRVQMLSRQTGKNQSELMREGLWVVVEQFDINQQKKRKKKSFGDLAGIYSCPDADPDAAINHDDVFTIMPWDEDESVQ